VDSPAWAGVTLAIPRAWLNAERDIAPGFSESFTLLKKHLFSVPMA
jgi:hypothetical protein